MVWWGYKTGENLCIPPSACFLFLELENIIFNQSCMFYAELLHAILSGQVSRDSQ